MLTFSVLHERGKGRTFFNLYVWVNFTINGFCKQSLKGTTLLMLAYILPGKYVSGDEIPDHRILDFVFFLLFAPFGSLSSSASITDSLTS